MKGIVPAVPGRFRIKDSTIAIQLSALPQKQLNACIDDDRGG